jgi:hypothetical protein
MIFAPSGGGSLPNATPGVLTAFWLGPITSTQTGTNETTTPGNGPGGGLEEPLIIALAVVVVVLAMFILLRRRTPMQGAATGASARRRPERVSIRQGWEHVSDLLLMLAPPQGEWADPPCQNSSMWRLAP